MAVYSITYQLRNNKNYELINEKLSKLGDVIRPLTSFWMVCTALSYNELYNFVIGTVDRDDIFYITAISSPGIGRLDLEDTNWIKNKFLIPVTPITPIGNPKGPLLVQQPAAAQKSAAHKSAAVHGRQQYPKWDW